MTIEVSAFAWVPPFAQGLVRDLRVRWALEEAELPYEERPVKLGENTVCRAQLGRTADHVFELSTDGGRYRSRGA